MIRLTDFMNRYNGVAVDVPWGYRGECVSLVQRYINEVFGVPLQSRGHGMDWEYNMVNAGLGKKVSTPQKGDLVVWGPNVGGGYGHVAIYLDKNFIFDQNRLGDRTARRRRTLSVRPTAYIRMNPVKEDKKLSFDEVVAGVKRGDYGNYPARESNVNATGFLYEDVQAAVEGKKVDKPSQSTGSFSKGDKVYTSATKDSSGTKLDGRKVSADREFTIKDISKDKKEALIDEISTWVLVSTLSKKSGGSQGGSGSSQEGNIGRTFTNTVVPMRLYPSMHPYKGEPHYGNSNAKRGYEILDEGNGRVQIQNKFFDTSDNKVWVAKSAGNIGGGSIGRVEAQKFKEFDLELRGKHWLYKTASTSRANGNRHEDASGKTRTVRVLEQKGGMYKVRSKDFSPSEVWIVKP